MFVLRNENLAGHKLATGEGLLIVDSSGVVEVKTKHIAEVLMTSGFESIAAKKSKGDKSKSEEDKTPKVDNPKKENPPKAEEPVKAEEPRKRWRKKHDD